MESFFKTLKVERVHRIHCATRAHARLDVVNWIEGFYSPRQLHSSTGYRSLIDAGDSWLPEVVHVESRQVTKAPALLRDCFCHEIRPDTTHSKGPPPATNQQSTANQAASPAERLCPDPE